MKCLPCLVLVSSLLFPACGGNDPKADHKVDPKAPTPQAPTQQPPTPAAAPAASDMDAAIKALVAKPEHAAASIQVQHILISFVGAGTKATRSKADAETLAKQVYAEVVAGGDFDALVKKYTDDSAPGKYDMTNGKAGGAPGAYPRSGMVRAFGDVGWRLQVGEVGVAPFEQTASPFGWHIIKRLK